jgi:drug/metabolite transporter (DMT)-like permease
MTYFKAVMPPAVYYMLLSALGFALMAACVKGASEYGIPVLEIVAARALVSLFISYIDIKRKRIHVWGQNKGLLIARGSVGAIALLCVYYAVTTLPLAEATIMQYTYPAFTALIALLFLKEKVQKATLLCIVLSLIGLVLMVQPTHGGSNLSSLPWLSVMAALAGGYAAGYYSYKWAEVLSADAFSRFEEEGVFNLSTGIDFRKNILEMGGSKEPMELFIAFRGREPKVDALLRHCGIQS